MHIDFDWKWNGKNEIIMPRRNEKISASYTVYGAFQNQVSYLFSEISWISFCLSLNCLMNKDFMPNNRPVS